MTNHTRLGIFAAIIAAMLAGCAGGTASSPVATQTPTLSEPSVATASPTPFPTTDWAALGYKKTGEPGYEIAFLGNLGSNYFGFVQVYIDQEPNVITGDAFATYENPGYITNTPRHALFNYAKTNGSPSATPGPLVPYIDPYGYTWGEIARTQNAMWPFDPSDYPDMVPPPTSAWEAAMRSIVVPRGVVQYNSINKNQILVYTALDPDTRKPILRYFVTDQWGNRYMMKSSNLANDTPEEITASFEAAVLPPGWTKTTAYLTSDVVVEPVQGGVSNTMFQAFRDSSDNAYDQIAWGAAGEGIPQHVGSPMPIWGGPTDTRLNGTPGDDLMYGGPGNDVFHPSTGQDEVDGGAGFNTVVLSGFINQYTVADVSGTRTVTGPDGTKSLTRVQRVQCRDGAITL